MEEKKCCVCNKTEKDTRIIKSKGKYYCRRHYLQIYRHGKVFKTSFEPNDWVLHDDYAEVILRDSQGKETGRGLIDLEDVDRLKPYKWFLHKGYKTNYVYSKTGQKNGHNLIMHRLVMNYEGELVIDHINWNGLDNRKQNLRIVTHQQNILNANRN
jgi:hypothetical protein